jgi:hypothetical protein
VPEAMAQATSRQGIFIWFLSKPPEEFFIYFKKLKVLFMDLCDAAIQVLP